MDKLVSILIPAYNSERWIAETIRSALNQTWLRKEIIIVDDGSSDNTPHILRSFQSGLVKIITQENMGSTAARNKALSYAQGDYIQWLDNDDLLAPDKISQQLKHSIDTQNERILFSASLGLFYYCTERAKFMCNSLWQDLTPLDYFLFKFNKNIWLQSGQWLVSRKLTEMAGPWLEIRTPDDDGEYFCRVVANCEKIKFVPEAIAYWRVGQFGSLNQARSDQALSALFISISRSIDHLRAFEDSDRTRAACLKYLHNRLWYFYPDKPALLEKAKNLARELGGDLLPPKESMKFSLVRKVFGWKIAKNLKNTVWRAETLALKNWDRLIFKIANVKKSSA